MPKGHTVDTLLNYWVHRADETCLCKSEMENTPGKSNIYS